MIKGTKSAYVTWKYDERHEDWQAVISFPPPTAEKEAALALDAVTTLDTEDEGKSLSTICV